METERQASLDPYEDLREKMSIMSMMAPHPDLLSRETITAPGGLTKDQHPILVLPDNFRFTSLTDEELDCLLSYYCRIHTPGEQKRGFVVIVDRRNDTWLQARATLMKLREHFPSRIEMIYCIEPNGIIQKTFGAGFKQVNGYNLPVKFVQKPEELCDGFIPHDQLPPTLGGPLLYDHRIWCEHRVAVEKYEMNTCELDAESTDVMDKMRNTDLPNETDETDELIKEQLVLRNHLKNDVNEGIKRGNALQDCVLQYDSAHPVVNLERIPDRMRNILLIRECMERLSQVEKQFDNFWSEHYPTLLQCQQLRKFEVKFRDLWPTLQDRLKALNLVSEKIGDAVDLVRSDELTDVMDDIEELIPQAKDILAMGKRLTAKRHYADDSIRPKCKELEELISELETKSKTCEEKLQRCRELEDRMSKAEKWCREGMDRLATRWTISPDASAAGIVRDIDQFLSETLIFKLDNPKEFHNQFKVHATPEMNERLPELLRELDEVRQQCISRKVSLGWKNDSDARRSSMAVTTSRPIRTGSR
ncbi:putative guanine nucleotide exchange factor MCF2L2 [Hypsibius exemplaris]|uniref:Guanine nucleotide exchange factor MCF2L2 n=1 Tax=Hypsibius exemplaris TaxID=2072580 RepID=A0A1W0WJG3_HYPEX|nr:putative guanine nucleotide exchange factor MCF2L2 [Hypsibius exemplaris]